MKTRMKILVTVFIVVIAILILGIIANVIRNNFIMKRLYESSNELKSSIKNYYYEKKSELSEGQTRTTTYKIYNYGDKYLIKEYYNDEGIITTEWIDKSIPEYISINEKTGKKLKK